KKILKKIIKYILNNKYNFVQLRYIFINNGGKRQKSKWTRIIRC
ncbi:MAG: hypothetical protein F083_3191, partial [bacterium F083]